jgi:subtilase family serine protease
MISLKKLFAMGAFGVVLLAVPQMGATAVPNRVLRGVDSAQRVSLPNSSHLRPEIRSDEGMADDSTVLSDMTLQFSMTASQQADLAELLEEQQNPSSPNYHQWLTPESFGTRFGLSDADLAAVNGWLVGQGFSVKRIGRAKNFIQFSGTAAQARRALGAEIHRVQANGTSHVASMGTLSLPAGIAGVVQMVRGMDDIPPVAHVHPIVTPNYTSSNGTHSLVPGDHQTIYDVKPTILAGTDGTGVTLVVVGQVNLDMSNVATFRSLSGLPAKTVTVKTYGSVSGTSDDAFESYLDVEWVGANAPNANLVFATSDNVFVSIQSAIDDNLGAIISNSYGTCEASVTADDSLYFDAIGQEANALGITILSASGDSGATDCMTHGTSGTTTATSGLSTDLPASAPHVTGVGGTLFNEGSGTYWATTAGTNYQTALSYIPETGWNETGGTNGIFASGGGTSKYYAKPAWQTGTGVPADSFRHVPDVAVSAAAHDAYVLCTPGYCSSGFASSGGSLSRVAGSSAAAPSFAGMLALVVQKTGARIGNANPYLYALARSTYSSNVFHDITTGNNQITCAAVQPTGSTCPAGTTVGYTANVGYDQVTGLGSVDATNLVTYWSQVTPTGRTGTTATTTTLSVSSSSGTVGGTDAFTVNVAPTSGTGVPTGTVFYVVNGVSYDFETLSGGSNSVTLPLDSGYFSPGTNTVVVKYLGDSTYAPSTSSAVTLTLSATGTTPASGFTITPETATITVASGSVAPAQVFTVSGKSGYTGTIAFSASTTSAALTACYVFTPASVTLNSTATTATTSFVLTAASCPSAVSVPNSRTLSASTSGVERTVVPFRKAAEGIMIAGVLLILIPRRRRWASMLLMLVLIGGLGLNGCGSSQSATTTQNTGGTTTVTKTTVGTYKITVTATGTGTGGTTSVSSVVTFVVN